MESSDESFFTLDGVFQHFLSDDSVIIIILDYLLMA